MSNIREAVEQAKSDATWDEKLSDRDLFGIHSERYEADKFDDPVQQAAYDQAYGSTRARLSND